MGGPARHHLHVAALIPEHISRDEVIAALHDHNTCLTLQALTTGHKELPQLAPEVRKDPYWYPPDIHPIKAYEVTEAVIIIPGVGEWGKKYITFPSNFQDTPDGIKTRADTSGVTLRAEFRVIPGGAGEGEVDGEGEGIGYADWVLVEDVTIECAWWMMPFVRRSAEGAHQDICKKVVEKVEMLKTQEAVANLSPRGKGKGRMDTNKDLPEMPDSEIVEAGPLPEKITYQ